MKRLSNKQRKLIYIRAKNRIRKNGYKSYFKFNSNLEGLSVFLEKEVQYYSSNLKRYYKLEGKSLLISKALVGSDLVNDLITFEIHITV